MAAISPLAGKPAPPSVLLNVTSLINAYHSQHPDPSVTAQRVVFGTSGHRGSSLDGAFNEDHIVAITQAICLHRKHEGVDGPRLLEPNHYLSVAIDYLFRYRPRWSGAVAVGKTVVTSSMIDRVAARLGRQVIEVPVGFKWFVDGLVRGTIGFCGEESAGATFLRRDGGVWTTDKDGLVPNLLAAEIMARTGTDPGAHYRALTAELGEPCYARIDAPATPEQKARLAALSPAAVTTTTLAGEPIVARLTAAPGNDAPIGGLKIVVASGWFAARPSGTENIYKIYAESFRDQAHLDAIVTEARAIVSTALGASAPSRGSRGERL